VGFEIMQVIKEGKLCTEEVLKTFFTKVESKPRKEKVE